MLDCAVAGITPDRFKRMTMGEIWVVVEASHIRRRNNVVDRIIACVRALGQAFGGHDALTGLSDEPHAGDQVITPAEARRMRFWR